MSTKADSIRAVRNRNPGNIERGAKWQGLLPRDQMTEEQKDEKRFAVFKSPVWGFRALATTLITYQDKRRAADGSIIDTIAEAITRWAPPRENDTEAYIRRVCKLTGFGRDQLIDFHSYEDAAPIVKAIATVECGGWFFAQRDLDEGLRRAGVVPSPTPRVVLRDRGVQSGTVATASTGAAGFMDMIGEAQDQFSELALYMDIAKYALLGLAVLSFLIFAYTKYKELKR